MCVPPELKWFVNYARKMLKNILQFLIAAFVGGGVSAALVNAGFSKRHEQQQWLRDQKLQASAKFLQAIYGLSNEMLNFENGKGDSDKFFEQQVESERSLLVLVSPPQVISTATAIADSVGKWVEQDRSKPNEKSQKAFYDFRDRITDFISAVRKDLKTDGDDNKK